MKKLLALTVSAILGASPTPLTAAQPAESLRPEVSAHRATLSLDGPGWRVLLDKNAPWENDKLYAPGEVPPLAQLPVRPPTGGWDTLRTQGVPCATPACVEQIFAKGDPRYVYRGVSWFSRDVKIPAGWKGHDIRLSIARAHLRVEVFVNRKLAGYDLCCESDCSFDLTGFLEPGKTNELAVRITNPGGFRGFDDTELTRWGSKRLPCGRNFGGIDTVTLTATDPIHAADVFVMNRPPALGNRIQIIPTVANPTGAPAEAEFTATILPVSGGAPLRSESWKATIPAGGGEAPSPVFDVPGAKTWSVGSPALHVCRLTIRSGANEDRTDTRFGFRVFEVKPRAEDGKLCFFLNGERFRHRSAIDFGFYAHTGFFGTPEQVRRSIQAAKDIGHNGINLHRHIGEYRMFDAADEMGLALYEEPGGLHQDQGRGRIIRGTLADKVIQEKIRRMAVRGRNHPSLLIHNLSNEDNHWDATRDEAIRAIHRINPTVFVCNASGDGTIDGKTDDGNHRFRWTGPNRHFVPYGDKLLVEGFTDAHTVGAHVSFSERTFVSHSLDSKKNLFYFGEAFCHCGPANFWLLADQASRESAAGSYDLDSSLRNAEEIADAFSRFHLADTGSRLIKTPADVSLQAGRGLMYADGRLSQRIMARDNVDGFAINGWSAHSYCTPPGGMPPGGTPEGDAWDSAILDEGRNPKGPVEDYAAWTKTAQIALFRASPKYVNPGDTARFEVNLVNEARIPAGDCTLEFTMTDGAGRTTEFSERRTLRVAGGSVFAQKAGDVAVAIRPSWHAGHLTLFAALKDAQGKVVAEGREQVLLQNRASWEKDLAGAKVAVVDWPAAEAALKDAQTRTVAPADANVIVAGGVPADTAALLESVKSGKTLIVKFDRAWAERLFTQGVLSKPVTDWGGRRVAHRRGWLNNGWGYLDHFVGDQGFPSKTTLGTNGWEIAGDPVGFRPFVSTYPLHAYGLHLKRMDMNGRAVTLPTPFAVPEASLGALPEAGLFHACGYGMSDIALRLPDGPCHGRLRFCEIHYTEAGKRLFDVTCGGKTLAEKFDILARAGAPFKPVDLPFEAVVTDGVLSFGFEAHKDRSLISAIEIEGVDASGKPWSRRFCFGQKAWKGYAQPRREEVVASPQTTLFVLLGAVDYGRGKILLVPSYPVDGGKPLDDMLFFNMISKATKKDW